jgi:hypothetical protein
MERLVSNMFKIQGDIVVNARGDVMAQKVYGQWESKDPEVLAFIAEQNDSASKEKPKAAPKKTKAAKAVEEE